LDSPRILPVTGVLACDKEILAMAREALTGRFGPPLIEGRPFPFTFTDYYIPQTGRDAVKQFLAFPPSDEEPDLAAWKRWALEREASLAHLASRPVPRPANLDPGSLSLGNLVLASTKDAPHRVYVGGGIFAEVELIWKQGAFEPLAWTYPDYRTPEALGFFAEARGLMKRCIRGKK